MSGGCLSLFTEKWKDLPRTVEFDWKRLRFGVSFTPLTRQKNVKDHCLKLRQLDFLQKF